MMLTNDFLNSFFSNLFLFFLQIPLATLIVQTLPTLLFSFLLKAIPNLFFSICIAHSDDDFVRLPSRTNTVVPSNSVAFV